MAGPDPWKHLYGCPIMVQTLVPVYAPPTRLAMVRYRTFRNTDPPVVTALWRQRAGQPGLMQPVSNDLFEQLVFAKLYFDPAGLILAYEDGQPVGFAHAGFGPTEAQDDVSHQWGVTSLILVHPEYERSEVPDGLLQQCEAYLQKMGAKVLYGGGVQPLNPFYLGLYGGAELPGVLDSDQVGQRTFVAGGYREIDRTVIFHRSLSDFQAVIDRQQMQIRRRMVVEVTTDPPTRTWWEACTLGSFELTRFVVVPRGGETPVASATFRAMEPIGAGHHLGYSTGLIDLQVEPSYRRHGLAVYLLSEVFRQFQRQGIETVEVQTMEHNAAALGVYEKLGFRRAGGGAVYRKEGG